jgi:hypothetical protein
VGDWAWHTPKKTIAHRVRSYKGMPAICRSPPRGRMGVAHALKKTIVHRVRSYKGMPAFVGAHPCGRLGVAHAQKNHRVQSALLQGNACHL